MFSVYTNGLHGSILPTGRVKKIVGHPKNSKANFWSRLEILRKILWMEFEARVDNYDYKLKADLAASWTDLHG